MEKSNELAEPLHARPTESSRLQLLGPYKVHASVQGLALASGVLKLQEAVPASPAALTVQPPAGCPSHAWQPPALPRVRLPPSADQCRRQPSRRSPAVESARQLPAAGELSGPAWRASWPHPLRQLRKLYWILFLMTCQHCEQCQGYAHQAALRLSAPGCYSSVMSIIEGLSAAKPKIKKKGIRTCRQREGLRAQERLPRK